MTEETTRRIERLQQSRDMWNRSAQVALQRAEAACREILDILKSEHPIGSRRLDCDGVEYEVCSYKTIGAIGHKKDWVLGYRVQEDGTIDREQMVGIKDPVEKTGVEK